VSQAVPDPSGPAYAASLRESPWLTTLDRAYRAKCNEANELRDENTKLKVTVETLKRRLYEARARSERQKVRREAGR
jgi:hypothetical protein